MDRRGNDSYPVPAMSCTVLPTLTDVRVLVLEVAKPLVDLADGKVVDVELAAQQQACAADARISSATL